MNQDLLKYRVGALLYMPACQTNVVEKLKKDSDITSIAFCLEDTIQDEGLEEAENCLYKTLTEIKKVMDILPKQYIIFIRVRTPQHMKNIIEKFNNVLSIVTGIILPKFDESNAQEYLCEIMRYNTENTHKLYAMPILESSSIADLKYRVNHLYNLKTIIDKYSNYILNIRVGGNDLSNLYGLRRNVNQTIYEMGVVRDILIDIINVFAQDYVVSAPVWEYYGENKNELWATGLCRELELDKLNGFIGKTAIHPSQVAVINESLKVSLIDYNDSLEILNYNKDNLAVSANSDGTRMNEIKCHIKWAKKINALASIYGVKGE